MILSSTQRQIVYSHRAHARGFTLVEVLCALIIFSVAIVGIIEGMGSAISIQSEIGMRRRAAILAENVMEELKYTGDLTVGDESGAYDGDNTGYSWRTLIEETDSKNLVKVTTSISWGTEGHGKDYTLTTLMNTFGGSSAKSSGTSNNANGANGSNGANNSNGNSGSNNSTGQR